MESFINIPIINLMYPLMYLIAFSVGASYIFYQAKKHNWHIGSVSVMLGATITAAVFGSKIVLIPIDSILTSFMNFQLPVANGKSFLGGVAGGLIGMLIAIRYLRLPMQVADRVAFILPVSLAIGRVGCLFAGCCFGKLTELPWGISYEAGSPAHFHHLYDGSIDAEALTSLSIHPVPVYEILFCILIVTVIVSNRHRLQIQGRTLFAVLSLYSFLRFGGEFLRYQVHDVVINNVQIATLSAGLFFMMLFLYRKKTNDWVSVNGLTPGRRIFKLLMLIITVVFIPGAWYSPVEMALLTGTFSLLSIILATEYISKSGWQPRYLKPVYFLLIPVIMIAASPEYKKSDSTDNKYNKFGFTTFSGNFGAWDIYSGPETRDACGYSAYPHWDGIERAYRYYGIGGSIERYENPAANRGKSYGVRAIYGKSETPEISSERRNLSEKNETILLVNPFIKFDNKIVGIGFGLHGGVTPSWRVFQREGALGYPEARTVYIEPMISLRLLPRHGIFLEARYQDAYPSSFPVMRLQAGAGYGYMSNGQYGYVRAGITDWGYYLETDMPITGHLSLSCGLGINGSNPDLNEAQNYLSIGLKYKPN